LVAGQTASETCAFADLGDLTQEDRSTGGLQAEFFNRFWLGRETTYSDEPSLVLDFHNPSSAVLIASIERFQNLAQIYALESHALGLYDNLELTLFTPQSFDARNAGNGLETRN
jgi:hypothetical protein